MLVIIREHVAITDRPACSVMPLEVRTKSILAAKLTSSVEVGSETIPNIPYPLSEASAR